MYNLTFQYFWFELSHWQHLLKQEKKKSKKSDENQDEEDDDDDDPVLKGEIARKVFEEAARSSEDNAEFLCSLLKLASGFEACLSNKEGHFGVRDIKR